MIVAYEGYGAMSDEGRAALLVGGDLLAVARLEDASSSLGVSLHTATVDTMRARLADLHPDVVILDLDSTPGVLDELTRARADGLTPARIVGYFSHVDDQLGEAARRAGCEPVPRGRFWRTLFEQLAPEGEP
jgi:hypothetical protein